MKTLVILSIIFLILILWWWLVKSFRMGKKEQQIYERTCPFDKEFCAILGKSINRENVTDVCKNCPRYLIFKGLDEKELRDKIKKITDENY